MEEIRKKIDQIFSRLDRLTPVSAGQSPVRLTDLGKRISQELDASAWAGRLAVPLEKHLAGKDAYEIQVFCFDHVEQVEYSDEEQKTIRRSAYNHGIDTWEVRRVLAIELRDKLLAIAGLVAP
ncbi:MAG: hypothetical protein OXN85_07760 [Gemmatimonadetes bacterium]|nr:hypothetical protein [Candidatus Palauibacter australiensis]